MAKKIIRTGTTADPTGDSLKNAFVKVNDNFTELYNALGLDADTLNIGAFEFTGSVISTTDSTAIVIDQAATITSNLSVGGDIVPQTANGGDLGSSTLPWRSLYVSNNTIYIGGTAVGLDANGNLTTGGTVVGSTPAWANITGKPTFATVATTGAYADLTGKPTIPTLVSQLANDSGFLTSVSNIQSESDVSIEVNLTDSTKQIWRFGEDGDLTFPDASVQTTAYVAAVWPVTNTTGTSGPTKIAIGNSAGNISQGLYAVAIGPSAGYVNQGYSAVAIGRFAGYGNQGDNAVAIGNGAGLTLQAANTIILNATGSEVNGVSAQTNSFYVTPIRSAAATSNVLYYNTTTKEVSYGTTTSVSSLVNGAYTASLGADGALTLPGDIRSDGNINIDINLSDSTLYRWQFGEDGALTFPDGTSQSTAGGSWPVTNTAGASGPTKVAIGQNAGNVTQGYSAVAVGANAGETSQGESAVAFGVNAGNQNQGIYGVAVGGGAGNTSQGTYGVAVGGGAGNANQGTQAVAVGLNAGANAQGTNSVAIGKQAGETSQAANTIILNASGTAVNGVAAQIDSFYVAPIRNAATSGNVLYYNTTTKEVTYGTPIVPNGAKASTDTGTAGQTSYDNQYFYVCVATNSWHRMVLNSY